MKLHHNMDVPFLRKTWSRET